MYIINETYFQTPTREIPNLDEADSKSFAELERLIDNECRLFMYNFLTPDEVADFNSYLINGLFPSDTTDIPQKWIDLVNGTTYTSNDVDLVWNGLIYAKGTSKNSLLADSVYVKWLENQASYMTGVGEAKGNPKGASNVNPTQRIVTVWNEFLRKYQGNYCDYVNLFPYWCGNYYTLFPYNYRENNQVSLIQFLYDNQTNYTSESIQLFEVRNQLGL